MESKHFEFKGEGKSLFGLILKNIFLTLVTLGFYYPFARTELRKYFWNHLEVEGEKFHYSGTGWDLLKGYLIVGAAYGLFLGVNQILRAYYPNALLFMPLILLGLAFFFLPLIIVASRSYLLTHTSLRGVSFSINKDAVGELRMEILKAVFFVPITLGLYYPILFHRYRAVLFNNMSYGSEKFRAEIDSGSYLWMVFIGSILSSFTLGIYSAWLTADIMKFNAERTFIQGSNFSIDIKGSEVLVIYLKSLLIIIFTLGLATPWVITMNFTFYVQKLSYNGEFNYSEVEQIETQKVSALGDTFGDALDVDLGI